MASKSTPKKPRSTQRTNGITWLKNVTKSLGMMGADVLKEYNPTIGEISTTAMKTSQEVYKQVRQGNISSQKVTKALTSNRYMKLADQAIKNALEDIKTGNFNNTERFEQSLLGGMKDSDSGMSFGDLGDGENTQVNVVETGLSEKGVAALGEISQRNTEAMVKATKASMDAQVATTTATMMQVHELGEGIYSRLDTANSHLSALVAFNNDNMLKFIESSTAFYEKIGSKMAPEEGTGGAKNTIGVGDVFLGKNGGFNFENYKQLIGAQAQDYLKNSQASYIASMVDSFGDALIANPLQVVGKMVIEQAIPNVVKNTMESVDSALSGALVTMMDRLGRDWGDSIDQGIGGMVKRFIGKSFGLKVDRKKEIVLAGKVDGSPATFDGYTHHAITEQIPKYLRESTAYLKVIADAVTGGRSDNALRQAQTFDYESGKYDTLNNIQKKTYRAIRDSATNSVKETDFGKTLVRAGAAEGVKDFKDYDEALNDFLYRLVEFGTPDFRNENWMKDIDELLAASSGTENSKAFIREAVQQSIKEHRGGASMAPGIIAGKQARNRMLEDMEKNPTAYNLYATTPLNEEVDTTMARILYGEENAQNTESHIEKRGSISDILENMNYLLERGINTRTLGFGPFPDDRAMRPNKRGFPRVIRGPLPSPNQNPGGNHGNQSDNNNSQGQSQNQNPNPTPEGGTDDGSELTEEQMAAQIREVVEEHPEDENATGVGKMFRNFGKGIIGGIYDILQGNIGGGASQIGKAFDPNGKVTGAIGAKLLGEKVLDEHGMIIGRQGGLIGKQYAEIAEQLKTISQMTPEELKAKVKDKASSNKAITTTTDIFRTGIYGLYESFFDDKINPEDDPKNIRKQMKERAKKKFKDQTNALQEKLPKELKDALATAKAGAARGIGGGIIGNLVGGPIGAAIGASVGIFTKSTMFQEFMYGTDELDDDGKRVNIGMKAQVMNAWSAFMERHKIGKNIDPITGKVKEVTSGKTFKMGIAGSGLGFIASMFTPIGPIGGALAGMAIGIASGEGKIHDFLFGKKNEEGEIEEKGVLGRIGTIIDAHWGKPLRNAASDFLEDSKDFLKDHVLDSVRIAFQPVSIFAGRIVHGATNFLKARASAIGSSVADTAKKSADLVGHIVRGIGPFIKRIPIVGKLFSGVGWLGKMVGKGTKALGGKIAKTPGAILNKMELSNQKESKKRYIRELEAIADKDPEAARKLAILKDKKRENQDHPGHEEYRKLVEEASTKYYASNYQEERAKQLQNRAYRQEAKRVGRGSRDATDRNKAFIASMTRGELSEDTPENREKAMAIFQKRLNRSGKNHYKGYDKNFKFEEMNMMTGELTTVETSVSETAYNTAELVQRSDDIKEYLKSINEALDKSTDEVVKKKKERKDAGDADWDKVDNADYDRIIQLQKMKAKAEKQLKKSLKNEEAEARMEKAHKEDADRRAEVAEENAKLKREISEKAETAKNHVFNFGRKAREFFTGESELSRAYRLEQERLKEEQRKEEKAQKKDKNRYKRNREIGIQKYYEDQRKKLEQSQNNSDESSEGDGGNGLGRGYERGTKNATPGPHLVGERGPEILHIPKGAHVDPNDKIINVRIAGIDKKGYKQFVKLTEKESISVGVDGSRSVLPVYNMGNLNSQTDKKTAILRATDSEENITTDMIEDDINDKPVVKDSNGNAVLAEEPKESLPEIIRNSIDALKNFKSNILQTAGVLSAFAAGGAIAVGLGQLAKNVTDLLGITDGGSNVNENTASVNEDGTANLDENGNVMQADKATEDEDLTIPERALNMVAGKRTKIDIETGKAETVNDFTNRSLSDIDAKTRGAYGLVTKVAPKLWNFGVQLSPGVKKVESAAKWIGRKVTTSKAGQAIAEAGSGFIPKFKSLVTETIPKIVKAIGDKISKTKWGSKVVEKLGPFFDDFFKMSDDLLAANASKITEFMTSIGGIKGIFKAINVASIVVGGINGATSMGYMFDVDPKDPNLPTALKAIMTVISTALGALQGHMYGAIIDMVGIVFGIEPFKMIGNFILKAAINALAAMTGTDWSANLTAAQENFNKSYEEYSRQEYESYVKYNKSQGNEVCTYEQFIANDLLSTSKEEYNNDVNANATARLGDWMVDKFGSNSKKKSSSDAVPEVPETTTPQTTDTSVQPTTDGVTDTSTDAGMGGFGGGVPYYSQNDPRWKDAGYGEHVDQSTMGTTGCGPTAMAMAAGANGKNVNPMQMARLAQTKGYRDETGTNAKFMGAAASEMGLSATEQKQPDSSFVHNQLSQGKPVILLGKDGGYGPSAFTKAGHYVVATGETSDGGLMINDPRGKQYSGKYNKKDVLGESARAWAIGGRGPETEAMKGIGDLRKQEYANKQPSTGTGVVAEDVIAVAKNEIGYKEKASNQDLEDKNANAGSANFTKYGAFTGCNGDYWCASFVCWCFTQAANGNKDLANTILCGGYSNATVTMLGAFQKANRITNEPAPGDIVFYKYNTDRPCNHVGIVASVSGNDMETIEGNTSGKSDDRNGGMVALKNKKVTDSTIVAYARPLYDNTSNFKGVIMDTTATVIGPNGEVISTDGSGTTAKSSGGAFDKITSFFTNIGTAARNAYLTGKWEMPDETTTENQQYDENGNPITTTGAAMSSDIPAFQGGNTANAEAAYTYFTESGYSPAAAAAIIGNLQAEAGVDLNPARTQGDKGANAHAAGLAQWESYKNQSSRWAELRDYANAKGTSWSDFGTQLEFIHKELSGSQKSFFKGGDGMANAGATPTTYEDWKASQDVEMATRQFEGAFERAGKPVIDKRISYAKGIYEKFANKPTGTDDTTMNGIGDLRRQEYGDLNGGSGDGCATPEVLGGRVDDLFPGESDDFGGFGPAQPNPVSTSYTPTRSISKQATTAMRTVSSSSGSAEVVLKEVITYLKAIADNTGVSSQKLDMLQGLTNLGTAASSTTNIGVTTQPQNPFKDIPRGITPNQRKAQAIARGGRSGRKEI